MDRIENHFPTKQVQAEMIGCVEEVGGTISSAMFQGPPDKHLQVHRYCRVVSPPLCTHHLSFAEIYHGVSNGHKMNNSGQENTRWTQTWSLLAFHNIAQGFLKSNF